MRRQIISRIIGFPLPPYSLLDWGITGRLFTWMSFFNFLTGVSPRFYLLFSWCLMQNKEFERPPGEHWNWSGQRQLWSHFPLRTFHPVHLLHFLHISSPHSSVCVFFCEHRFLSGPSVWGFGASLWSLVGPAVGVQIKTMIPSSSWIYP